MENQKRLLALDVFRGLTIALMIIVNNPGSWETVYRPLLHSSWNGCTPTDLVFPFFMFIVGTAMWYSYKKSDHRLTGEVARRIIRRSLLIYIIGLAINAFAVLTLDVTKLRLMGVLARIALAYMLASFIVLLPGVRWIRIVTALILVFYWGILVIFGGSAPFSLEGNFVRTFDTALLGLDHIPEFHGVRFDQTGLLSTLPSLGNILFGYLAGRLIDIMPDKISAVRRLLLWGTAGVIAAILWNMVFPINKPLWTSSFVLYTCGFAAIILGILLWIIDVRGIVRWSKPFMIFGLNPIFLYVFSEILAISLGHIRITGSAGEPVSLGSQIYESLFRPLAGPFTASLLFAVVFMALCWFTGWLLYKRKIIIKL